MKWLVVSVALMVGFTASFLFFVSPVGEIAVGEAAVFEAPRPVTILAFGDMMLDRRVRAHINEYGPEYPFAQIKQLIAGHDIVVANAEGAFGDRVSVSARDHTILQFTFATATLPTLKALGFTAFSQANNHALNFGWSGLRESQARIRDAGIDTFGDPENAEPGPVYQNVRGVLVAFVGYDQFASNAGNSSTTLAAITSARGQNAFVIVYPHWGEEYNLGTTTLQSILAHKFVDAGADLVLGAHPHVVEPMEMYNGKPIYYSLGNFIFDQSFSTSTSNGLAIEVTLDAKSVSYQELPFSIINDQAIPSPIIGRSFVLQR